MYIDRSIFQKSVFANTLCGIIICPVYRLLIVDMDKETCRHCHKYQTFRHNYLLVLYILITPIISPSSDWWYIIPILLGIMLIFISLIGSKDTLFKI